MTVPAYAGTKPGQGPYPLWDAVSDDPELLSVR